MTFAEKMTIRAERARRNALCTVCCGSPPRPGSQRCDDCIERNTEFQRKKRAERLRRHECVRCGSPAAAGQSRCAPCRRRDLASYESQARPQCARCGGPRRRGHRYCAACAAVQRRAALVRGYPRERAYRKQLRQEYLTAGICPQCGCRDVSPGMRSCATCRTERNASRRARQARSR